MGMSAYYDQRTPTHLWLWRFSKFVNRRRQIVLDFDPLWLWLSHLLLLP